MLVQCPKCRTTYKVSDEVLSGAAPAFRCSRCKHTFELEPAENHEPRFEPSQAAETANAEHSHAGELSLPFGSKSETGPVPSDAEQEQVLRDTTGAASQTADRHAWGIGDTAQPQEEPFILAEPNPPVAEFPPAAEYKEDDPFFH
ncbi:MAG: zinc-ribbon domain-containing protein, partial [Candidatus Binatia bacterium]